MNGPYRVEGEWPSPITITRGWAKARARPWNDESPDGFLRLERGGVDFLRSATDAVTEMAGGRVFSPALFGRSTRIWQRAGYREVMRLEVMERPLGVGVERPGREIAVVGTPPWRRILEIDQLAFQGFWRMSLDGLREALNSTSSAAVLIADIDGHVAGFAIVGSQWGTAYLQRVAVEPERRGKGIGTDLVRASVRWARSTPSATIVLNVRSANTRAKRVYERCGFRASGTNLRILRYEETTLLDK